MSKPVDQVTTVLDDSALELLVPQKRPRGLLAGSLLAVAGVVVAFFYASGFFAHDATDDAPLPSVIIEGD